jgi:peptidyl-prolyl cis-trans isomerase B (cyclophilin B)
MLAALAACGERVELPAAEEAAPRGAVPEATGPRDVAVLQVEGFGEIRIELLPEVAPQAAQRFANLALQGLYDGTTFHRVVPGLAIEGGGPTATQGDVRAEEPDDPGAPADDAPGLVSHLRGVVSVPHGAVPDAGVLPFLITVADRPELDAHHTVFGLVVAGFDVADRIALVPRDVDGREGPRDRPLEPVVVSTLSIERGAGGTRAVRGTFEEEAELGPSEWHEGGF